jgi:hypothetical protein
MIAIYTHFLAWLAGMGLYALLFSTLDPDRSTYRRPPVQWLKSKP